MRAAVMGDSPLIAHVHPDVVYRRIPIADEANGLVLLRAAGEAIVDAQEIWDVYFSSVDCDCGTKDCLSCNYDAQRMIPRLQQILERNSQALELYGEVLKLGRVQFPEPMLAPWFGGSEQDHRIELWQLKGLETWWALEQQDWLKAARTLRQRARFTSILAKGEGTFGKYISALGEQRAVLRAALRLVDQAGVDLATLKELEPLGEDLLTEEDLAQAMRVDFSLALKQIERIDQVATAEGLIDAVVTQLYEQKPPLHDGDVWDDEGRIAQRRRQMHFILEDHPRLWDAGESVRALSHTYAYYCSRWEAFWQPDKADVRRWEAFWQHWPGQLEPHFAVEMFGDTASAAATRAEYPETYAEPGYGPVSAEKLSETRDAMRAIDNPLGVIVEYALWPTDIDDLRRDRWVLGRKLRRRVRWRRSLLGRFVHATQRFVRWSRQVENNRAGR